MPDPGELLWVLMSEMARSHFEDFLKMFYQDFSEKIDFDFGWEFLDDEIANVVPQELLNRPNAMNFLAKVTLKTGLPCRFAIHFVNDGEGRFQCGIAEIPEGAVPWMALRIQNRDGGFSAN